MKTKKQSKLARKIQRNKTSKTKSNLTTCVTYFGYTESVDTPFCMISQVDDDHLYALSNQGMFGFKINDWFLSVGECDDLKIRGPFKSYSEAMEYCTKSYPIKRFESHILDTM